MEIVILHVHLWKFHPVNDCELKERGSIRDRGKKCQFAQEVNTSSQAYQASYSKGIGTFIPVVKPARFWT